MPRSTIEKIAAGIVGPLRRLIEKEDEFRVIFDFKPSGIPALKKLEQEKVDDKLTGRAIITSIAFKRQEEFLGSPPPKDCSANVYGAWVRELKETEVEIKWRKKYFWKAHGFAKKEGFMVREKITDYLPAELS